MKNFEKPVYEVVSFTNNVIRTSGGCGCYDELLGHMDGDCLGDTAYCECTINMNPAEKNCCYTYES